MRRLRWLTAAVIAMCAFAVYAEDFVFQDIKVYRPDNSSIFTASAITFENLSHDKTHSVTLSVEPKSYRINEECPPADFQQITLKPDEKITIPLPHRLFQYMRLTAEMEVDGHRSDEFILNITDDTFYDRQLTANMEPSSNTMWRMPVAMWPADTGILQRASTIYLPENQPIPAELREALLDYALQGGEILYDYCDNRNFKEYGFGAVPDLNGATPSGIYGRRIPQIMPEMLVDFALREDVSNRVTVLLFIFAICAGPATVLFCRKKKYVIFWVIPAIAIIFSAIIAAIAIWTDGIQPTIKYATFSIIDEVRQKSATVNEFEIIHPMPMEKDICLPPNADIRELRIPSGRARIYFAPDKTTEIKNALAARMPFEIRYVTLEPQSAKLEINPVAPDKIAVKNTLEREISSLYVKAPNGNILYTDQAISPGQTAELDQVCHDGEIKIKMPGNPYFTPGNRLLNQLDYIATITRPLVEPPAEYDNANIEQNHIVFGLKSSPGGELWK